MRPRQHRDDHTKRERRNEWKMWKLPIYERSGWKCEICGADIHRGGEIHNNPYYNIRLQEEKALEYNINLKDLYNYGKKLDERKGSI
jgi:hypothetical protein